MKGILQSAVLAAAMISGFANPAHAAGKPQIVSNFYSDDTYTVQVGRFTRFCDGTVERIGQPTIYDQVFEYDC